MPGRSAVVVAGGAPVAPAVDCAEAAAAGLAAAAAAAAADDGSTETVPAPRPVMLTIGRCMLGLGLLDAGARADLAAALAAPAAERLAFVRAAGGDVMAADLARPCLAVLGRRGAGPAADTGMSPNSAGFHMAASRCRIVCLQKTNTNNKDAHSHTAAHDPGHIVAKC